MLIISYMITFLFYLMQLTGKSQFLKNIFYKSII